MQLVWLCDTHFNFVTEEDISIFCKKISGLKVDAVMIGGDISTAPMLAAHLKSLETYLDIPIYFVLGNHDYYHGSIAEIRQQVTKLSKQSAILSWLPASAVVELTADTALIGHGCWADGRLGNYEKSDVELNDFVYIAELANLDKGTRLQQLKAFGDESADYLREVLLEACAKYLNIIILAHVPPFREACWHEGSISNDHFLPHFSCKAAGQVIAEAASNFPDIDFTVLCGHTHSAGDYRHNSNLRVRTAQAQYGQLEIQDIIAIS